MSSLFHSQEFDEVVSITDRLDAVDGIEVADVEQTQKIVPFITCEISLCQYVCELVFYTSRLWCSRGAALLAASHFGRVVGPPTASRRNGPGVAWVSLSGPTVTHPG